MTISAALPVDTLVGSLSRAGWGPLAGRRHAGVRDTLQALAHLLPHGSAEGRVTVAQVADVAGLSAKWTARCMNVLQSLGIISTRRGRIAAGQPTPGWVRIAKKALVQLVLAARPRLAEVRTARALATRARIREAGLVDHFNPIRRRSPLSSHMEATSTLPFLEGGNGATTSAPVSRNPHNPEAQAMTTECIHRNPDINRCALCRAQLKSAPGMDVTQLYRKVTDEPVVRLDWRAELRRARYDQDPIL